MEQKKQDIPSQGRLLYEGRSKRVYETSQADAVFIEFKTEFPDNGSVSDNPTKAHCASKVAEHVFKYLNSFRIPNHFVRRLDTDMMMVNKMEMIPIAVIVRNVAAGSLCDRFGLDEATELEFPVIELAYKNYKIGYPLVNESHILAFGISTSGEIRTMLRIATKANAVMRSFVERRNLRLADMWLEFGRVNGEIMIGDAIYPDTLRLIDVPTNQMFDGSLYRLGIGDYKESYRKLYQRLIA